MSSNELMPQTPRIWLTSFYDFNPEETGYLGFTKQGDRDSFIKEARKGDLVLIYASGSTETAPDERKQVKGFLEVDLVPIKDSDRASEAAKERKKASGWEDRWTHAVPVRRAWKITCPIEVKNIAPETYNQRAMRIAVRGELIKEAETTRALQLPVVQTNVFGEPPIALEDNEPRDIGSFFKPSKGIQPAFGKRTSNYVDGECFLYKMIAKGDIGALLGQSSDEIGNKELVKVGYSNDPERRCMELNAGIPPEAVFKWHLEVQSKPFPNGQSAFEAEKHLKAELAQCSESLGGEFFLGTKRDIDTAFYGTPGIAILITGAYRSPKN
jgi:hypothetical protein